jgi:serralysin
VATIYGSNRVYNPYNYGEYIEVIDAADGVTNGADVIFGLAGKDIIYGLGGNDVLKGGGGADKLYGGEGTDTADYSDSGEGVDVSLAAGAGSGGTAQGDKLYDIENLSGSAYDDTLQGDENANSLYGEGGNDVLKGGGGSDKLYGGGGDDLLNSDGVGDFIDGGAGNDTANFVDSQYGVYVNLGFGRFNQGYHYQPVPPGTPDNIVNVENVSGSNSHDYIIGNDVDNVLSGNGGVDHIWGYGGNDTINGGADKDFLIGGAGNDFLTGGAGDDTFTFGVYGNGPVNMGNDTITDFTDGDKLHIDDAIFSDFADVQAHMQQVGNDVVITYDGNNSITLENTTIGSMNANDFLFY